MPSFFNKIQEKDTDLQPAQASKEEKSGALEFMNQGPGTPQQETIRSSGVVKQLRAEQQKILQAQRPNLIQRKSNKTGMPDSLKAGLESHSGIAMDDVKVHYNSPKPSQLQAHAYTQGSDIHISPGQEKHLAHEAWHVVQQKQGRVRPTTQFNGAAINDDKGLEKEADVMGGRVLQAKEISPQKTLELRQNTRMGKGPLQLKLSEAVAGVLRAEQLKLYGDVDEELQQELVDKYNDDQISQAINEMRQTRGAPQAKGAPVPVAKPKALSFAEIMAEEKEQKKQQSAVPAPVSTWASKIKTAAPPGQTGAFAAPPKPLYNPQPLDPVPALVAAAKAWDKKNDVGKKNLKLNADQLSRLLAELAAITTKSGKSAAFNVGLSVGEEKYAGHVCVKAISKYSPPVSQATSHQPTYHFEVSNMDEIPKGLEDWDLDEK